MASSDRPPSSEEESRLRVADARTAVEVPADSVAASAAPPSAPPRLVRPAAPGAVAAPPDPLSSLQYLAVLGVAALVVGRFLAPALPGAVVGMARAVRIFELLGGGLSQLFAFGAIFGLSTALIGAANSTVPAWIRLVAMGVSAYTSLVVIGGAASNERVPETSALIAAALAGGFAILAALASRGSRVTRLHALVIGLVGAASLLRALFGFVDVVAAGLVPAPVLLSAGRAIATVATLSVAAALLLALVQIGRSAPPQKPEDGAPARSTLWSPVTILVLVLAVVCARQALLGGAPEATGLNVILKRASDRFLAHPEPHLRLPVRLFLGFLTPLVATALLFVRRMRSLTAAVVLAIVAADITGAPLGAIALVIASLGVLLVARSGHVLWSALIARSPEPPRDPS